MRLARTPHDVSALAEFYAEALTAQGALCERTWHDRLCVIAEGAAGRLWNADGALHEVELQFVAAEAQAPRDAAREVFPGCPLTFRLAEAVLDQPCLERAALRPDAGGRQAPAVDIAARLWSQQFAGSSAWQLEAPFQPGWHPSLVALVRTEIQAIEQNWSLHRLVLNLANGLADDSLAAALDFATVDDTASPTWPPVDPIQWRPQLTRLLEAELASDLTEMRRRQTRHLQRELERIDDYFDAYEQELRGRRPRAGGESRQLRVAERLAAAAAERQRRRDDQVQRHEIRVIPHWDALLLLAEPAWVARVSALEGRERRPFAARFVPRLRQWFRQPAAD